MSDFDQSAALFQQVLKSNPHRLDHIDTYSNILFVTVPLPLFHHTTHSRQDSRAELSVLAHNACKVDPFRAETCCVIGVMVVR